MFLTAGAKTAVLNPKQKQFLTAGVKNAVINRYQMNFKSMCYVHIARY